MGYASASDLGVVTSYYNPCGYRVRAHNFERFVEPLRAAGIPLVIVEAGFPSGDAPRAAFDTAHGEFTLPEAHGSCRVSARDVMWQKERLLNEGLRRLPARCTKVAWLDADVLFESDEWAVETSRRLDRHAVVQPFEEVVRLPRGALAYEGLSEEGVAGATVFRGFGAVHASEPEAYLGGNYERHGHTGFAWAARRDLLERTGLYDACIAGSGDHMMAHGFCLDSESACVRRIIGRVGFHAAHFREWTARLLEELGDGVSFTPGRLLHLWHGSIENRRYVQRNQELLAMGFHPKEDIRVGETGAWEWASDKPELHAWARRYFVERREDEE